MRAFYLVCIVFAVVFAAEVSATTKACPPRQWYSQKDPDWGSIMLGTSKVYSIEQAGCAMTDVAMTLSSYGIGINNRQANPLILNNYLIENGGYEDGDLIIWDAIAPLGNITLSLYQETIPTSQLQQLLDDCQPVIGNVLNGTHWVLLTDYDPKDDQIYYVNDPYFDTDYYYYDTIIWYVVYEVGAPPSFNNPTFSTVVDGPHQEEIALSKEAEAIRSSP